MSPSSPRATFARVNTRSNAAPLLSGIVLWGAVAAAAVPIEAGRFAPLFGLGTGQESLPVKAFRIDERPVSNRAFAEFVAKAPHWQPERTSRALADERYLSHFDGGTPAPGFDEVPVTWVSWFAAEAFCEAKGGRLPRTLEWEYVAAADETRKDASKDAAFADRILKWYAHPFSPEDLKKPGSPKNAWGVSGLHGLVWEWTLDFNGVFVTGDNRQDGDKMSKFFCGSAATGSARREDYAAFMRYALRSSLTARSTLANLGFRCVYDLPEVHP